MATRLHKDVKRLIGTHGYAVSFSRAQSGGSYDTETGIVTGGEELAWGGRGVFVNYRDEEVDGTSITTDDRKLLLQAVGLIREPEINDLVGIGSLYEDYLVGGSQYVTSDGDVYTVLTGDEVTYEVAIQDVRKLQSGNTVIAYMCRTRG